MSISGDVKWRRKCSKCGREHQISLNDVSREITINCDCGNALKITDVDGKGKEANKKLDEIERLLKQIGGRFTPG